jgi:hypothetical protein
MKLTHIAVLSLGTTLLVASAASATTFKWTYEDEFNRIYMGFLEGTLQADNNTVHVFQAKNTTLDGVLLPATPFVYQDTQFPDTPGIVSFNGSIMDFAACQDVNCNQLFSFSELPSPPISFFASANYGTSDENFDAGFWTLQTVPEPSSILGILSVSLIGGWLIKRK